MDITYSVKWVLKNVYTWDYLPNQDKDISITPKKFLCIPCFSFSYHYLPQPEAITILSPNTIDYPWVFEIFF